MPRSVEVRISGRVQGVAYRMWCEETATRLGLTGWVRNRRDGDVEAAFSGEPTLVDEMLEACRRGPPGARVARVEVTRENVPDIPRNFEVRSTR